MHKISTGKFFGEIALIMRCERTASVKTSNYVVVGAIGKFEFRMLCDKYPDLLKGLKKFMIHYHDRRKVGIIERFKTV